MSHKIKHFFPYGHSVYVERQVGEREGVYYIHQPVGGLMDEAKKVGEKLKAYAEVNSVSIGELLSTEGFLTSVQVDEFMCRLYLAAEREREWVDSGSVYEDHPLCFAWPVYHVTTA